MNERKSQMVSTEKVGILAVIANEQGSKLVNPSKAAFTGEALLVDRRIKPAFRPRIVCLRLRLFSQMLGITW